MGDETRRDHVQWHALISGDNMVLSTVKRSIDMPPFLRHGQAIGRNLKPKSQKYHLCDCWDCSSSTTVINSPDGLPSVVNGRLLGPSEYKVHTAKARRSGVGTYWDATLSQAHLNDVDPPLNGTLPGVPPKNTSDRPNVSNSSKGKEQLPIETIDQLYTILKSVQLRLESFTKSNQDLCATGALVFTSPPNADSPPIARNSNEIYALTQLEPADVANENIIRFEEWLVRTKNYLRSHPMRRVTSKLRVLESIVTASLDDAEMRVRRVKEEQWEALRVAAVNRRRCTPILLDTSTCLE